MNSENTASKAIIGKALTFSFALYLTGSAILFTNTSQAADLRPATNLSSANVSASADAGQDASTYSADDLDNLLAPIALYPDPLLAQVLLAATFDDQIQDASQVLSAGAVAIDNQTWDDSVKAVAHYPKVLFTMAAQPDWTGAVGQAYVAQSIDVMNSIQRLRSMAFAQGNLVSTQQQLVAATDGAIQILPARAGYMFLPAYDPAVVFSAPAFVSFGPPLAINASCNDHIDWHGHHIFDGSNRFAKTGDRGSRGLRNVRQSVRGGFTPVARSRYNPGFARGPVSRGQSNAGFSRGPVSGPVNRGYYNPRSTNAAANHNQTNSGSGYAPANHGQSNPNVSRPQMNRSSIMTAMNRGFVGTRPAGRGRR